MIEPMMKYTFLAYHGDYGEFLTRLQEQGMVHVNEKEQGQLENEGLAEQYKQTSELRSTIKMLQKLSDESDDQQQETDKDGFDVLAEVKTLQQKIDKLKLDRAAVQKDIDITKPWGKYDLSYFKKIADAGYQLRFFVCPSRKFNAQWNEQFTIEAINHNNAQDFFVVIAKRDENVDIDAEEIKLPAANPEDLIERKQELEKQQDKAQTRLTELANTSIKALQQTLLKKEEELGFSKVELSTENEAENTLRILEGWIPSKKQQKFEQFLEKEPVYFERAKANPQDKVPVLLKNKRFPRLFEPLGELYSLPNYRELDLTPFFAPFYMLFFGFCLGDAGYGLLMVATGFLKSPKRKKLNPILTLVQWLGVATILFGIIGGTLFGINLYQSGWPVYADLQSRFDAQNTSINEILFNLSIIIGAIQILFGLFLKAANESRQFGFKYSLGTIGWIVLFIGLGFYVYIQKTALLPDELAPYFLYGILGISGVLILLLNNPDKNVFINFGAGLWNTYNMVTGVLGDLLSYIRLFALGISSAILGFVFNSLAVQMSPDIPVIQIVVMVIILLIGHGINLFMSGLGAFVHPMRLTFVEFYKNAGFTGGGSKYAPFSKAEKN